MATDTEQAAAADEAGIERIGVDLEHEGKAPRQAGHDTRVTQNTLDDLRRVGRTLRHAELFVRINPPSERTAREVEQVLDCGARWIMLPYFRTPEQIVPFVETVRGRAKVFPLIETPAALECIGAIAALPGVAEVMIGLNDLRLQLGIANHFELLASPRIDTAVRAIRETGMPFAIGGVGRVDDRTLPVSADLVHAQYPRLGATGALISRAFSRDLPPGLSMRQAIADLRINLDRWAMRSPEELEAARADLAAAAAAWR